MRELPITFNDEMVRAIIRGDKTVTRRVVKLHSPYIILDERADGSPWPLVMAEDGDYTEAPCPYGAPGDLLWVRECFAPLGDVLTEIIGRSRVYRADANLAWDDSGDCRGWRLGEAFIDNRRAVRPFNWMPSIFMPRWASRLTLRVTSVRVERLQDITEEDARTEGVYPLCGGYMADVDSEWRTTAREAFRDLWDGLSKPGARWADNPWVWVIEFERMEASHV